MSADGYETSNIRSIGVANSNVILEHFNRLALMENLVVAVDDNTSMNPYREKKKLILKPKQNRSWKVLLSWFLSFTCRKNKNE